MRPRVPPTAAALLLAGLILAPGAHAQSAAQGDSYLGAIRLNPGTDSAPGDIVEPAGAGFTADTTNYGRQADVFSPPNAGGVPEPNKCAAVRYGRTVWAWFHTDRWVRTDLHVTASFPALFALMPFRSPAHPALDPAAGVCISTPGTDIAFGNPLPAAGPGWYAIQVGGQDDAGGQVTAALHLLPPSEVAASANITAKKKGGGVAVNLRVTAAKGARIALRCVRVKCGPLKGAAAVKNAAAKSYLRRTPIPDGARLELRVTSRGFIGRYMAWDVKKGRLGNAIARCMEPGSTRPHSVCDG
jgi:hypothetical protein